MPSYTRSPGPRDQVRPDSGHLVPGASSRSAQSLRGLAIDVQMSRLVPPATPDRGERVAQRAAIQMQRIATLMADPVQRDEGGAAPPSAPPAAEAQTQTGPGQEPAADTAGPRAASRPDAGSDDSRFFAAIGPAPTELVDEATNTLMIRAATEWANSLFGAFTFQTHGLGENVKPAADALVQLEGLAKSLRSETVRLVDTSSVTKKDRSADPTLPTLEEIHAWSQSIAQIRRTGQAPAFEAVETELDAATRAGCDAAVACFQAQQVLQARKSWRVGAEETDAEGAKDKDREKTEVDEIFKVGGWRQQSTEKKDDGTERLRDWCGMTVAANLVRGAGMDPSHAMSFSHTSNGVGFFTYNKQHATNRVKNVIWAEEEKTWMRLSEYHELRGSPRKWTSPQEMDALYKAGETPDVQPGDVVFVDTNNDKKANHYAMAESSITDEGGMTTIEGNAKGIKAGADGGARRNRDGRLQGGGYKEDGVAAVLNDMRTSDQKAEGTKSGPEAAAGHGARKGSKTTRAIGRPSVVDFESHSYAAKLPPEEHRNKSPEELAELPKKQKARRRRR